MKQAYSVLSKLYDKLMTDFDYLSYYEFTKEFIKGSVVELACGSGAFTKLYSDKIEKTVAVDNCKEMLSAAVHNNYKNRKYIDFVNADMLIFKPNAKADTVLCVCDGINYASHNDAALMFRRVFDYMNCGGYFIFDISSEYKIKNVIGNNIFYDDNDDYTYLWTNSLNACSVDMEITVFKKSGDVYTREDEGHTQFIHSRGQITDDLENAGFEVKVYDGESFGAVQKESKRLLFLCLKR